MLAAYKTMIVGAHGICHPAVNEGIAYRRFNVTRNGNYAVCIAFQSCRVDLPLALCLAINFWS
jgi:hypothetical protein